MPLENQNFPYTLRLGLDVRSCMNLFQFCNDLD